MNDMGRPRLRECKCGVGVNISDKEVALWQLEHAKVTGCSGKLSDAEEEEVES